MAIDRKGPGGEGGGPRAGCSGPGGTCPGAEWIGNARRAEPRGRAGGPLRGLAPLPPAAALAVFFGADQHQLARGRANSLRKMGRPAISEDDLATLLVVGEVSIGVRLGAALSTASPCSSTKPLQSPLFADVPALNTAPAVEEKAEAEAEAHGQGQGRQGLSRRPPRAAMSEAAAAIEGVLGPVG